MPIVPDSSGEGVILNSPSPAKKLTQSPVRKNHFFTYFYKNSSEFQPIVEELKRFAFKGKIQSEISPTTGRPHLQGMIWCKTKHRDTEFKTLKGAHFEPIKDIDDVANYCNKDETHDGVFRTKWGFPEKYIKTIDKLYPWEEDIISILTEEPDERTINWYWEPNGCAGKTTFSKYLFTHYERCVVLSGKGADMKNAIIQYEEANKCLPRIVLINIPRASKDFISYTGIEEIKDMFFHSGKYEGGMVCGPNPHVIVFANHEPSFNEMSADRWRVIQI